MKVELSTDDITELRLMTQALYSEGRIRGSTVRWVNRVCQSADVPVIDLRKQTSE